MNKTLVILGAAVLAASVTSLAAPTTAEAKKGFHFGGGHKLHLFGHRHRHHHWRRRHIIVAPIHTETYRVRKPAPIVRERKILVSYADGMGRVFDPASKAWHDGQNHCWSGQSPWTFKNGSWFYGNYRWFQSGDTWRSDAPEAPFAVECQTVPAFAAKLAPNVTQSNGGYSSGSSEPTTPVRNARQEPANPGIASGSSAATGACKKYFPSVGEMLPVPCTN